MGAANEAAIEKGCQLVIGMTPELRAALDAIPQGMRADGVLNFITNESASCSPLTQRSGEGLQTGVAWLV